VKKEYRLRTQQDEDADSPRAEMDNLGVLLCWHKRKNLGDDNSLSHGGFSSWEDIETYLREERGAIVVLPVYMYDHSGISLSTSPFSCPWDSGQIGFIYTTRAKADEYMVEGEEIAKCLDREVQIYSQWLSGDVWGYIVEEVKACTTCGHTEYVHVDSCWGFYGEKAAREAGEESLSYLCRKPEPCPTCGSIDAGHTCCPPEE
jgi:hypothetical protein